MFMRFDIVSFGSCVLDAFVFTDLPEKKNFIAYPVGSKILIKDLKFDVGGGGLNTSTTFSRMKLKAGLICKIGKDSSGKKILSEIKKEKINFLGKVQGTSGFSVVLDSKFRRRTILTYKGANDSIRLNEIPNFETNWIYLASLLGESLKTQKKLARMLKNKKTKIAFNPSSYLIEKEDLREILELTDILVINKEEAEMLEKKSGKLSDLIEIVCVTDGEKPFFCYTNGEKYKIFPHQNVKAVERTGAGDAFASGFVAALIKTNDIVKALQVGVANSESVIRYFGSRNKVLNWNEALDAVRKNPCRVVRVR